MPITRRSVAVDTFKLREFRTDSNEMAQIVRAVVAGHIAEFDAETFDVDERTDVDDFATLQLALDLDQPDIVVITTALTGFDAAHRVASLRLTSPRSYVVVVVASPAEARATEHAGAHMTVEAGSATALRDALRSVLDQVRADPHRRIVDRRRTDRGVQPDGSADRRGINWGPSQRLFNEGLLPPD